MPLDDDRRHRRPKYRPLSVSVRRSRRDDTDEERERNEPPSYRVSVKRRTGKRRSHGETIIKEPSAVTGGEGDGSPAADPAGTYREAAEDRKRRYAAHMQKKSPAGAAGRTDIKKRVFEKAGRSAKRRAAALIAAGVLLLAVLVVSAASGLTSSVAASPFGVLLSAEDSGGRSMRELIADITDEYRARLEGIERSSGCQRVEYDTAGGPYAVRWDEILSVYAVLVSRSSDTVTLDSEREKTVKRLFDEMNRVSWSTETAEAEDGEETVLRFSLSRTGAQQKAEQLGFSKEEKSYVDELLSGDYAAEWARLIGSFRPGGQILDPDSVWSPSGILQWPLSGPSRLTSGFGYRSDPFTGERRFHAGTDLACSEGTPVLASAEGKVVYVNSSDPWGYGYGYYVKLDHGGGLTTLYGHCSAVSVTDGQEVKTGEVIAYSGSTGYSTGPHLHFEVAEDGVRKDPMMWFSLE